ncbi:hypothetical protein ASE43_16800 [Lysobacter sp. Root983]|nr:hypothetical protein ASE43_16800 [Lysobacter sp. Root983]
MAAFGAVAFVLAPLRQYSALSSLSVSLLLVAMLLFYMVFALVSIWRCAHNANSPVWGGLARVSVALSVAWGVYAVWRAF